MKGSSGSFSGESRRAAAWIAAGLIVLVPAPGKPGEAGAPAAPIRNGKATAEPCPSSPSWSGSPHQQCYVAALRGKQ